MRVTKCPSDTLSMTNRVVVNKEDWDPTTTPHLQAGGGGFQVRTELYSFKPNNYLYDLNIELK